MLFVSPCLAFGVDRSGFLRFPVPLFEISQVGRKMFVPKRSMSEVLPSVHYALHVDTFGGIVSY